MWTVIHVKHIKGKEKSYALATGEVCTVVCGEVKQGEAMHSEKPAYITIIFISFSYVLHIAFCISTTRLRFGLGNIMIILYLSL